MLPLFRHRESDNIFMLRRKSAWLTTATVINMVTALGVAVQPFLQKYRFILMMDAAPVHIPKRVVQACTRSCLHFMGIPASMTALLQPLDTHSFSIYKMCIRNAIGAAVINGSSSDIGTMTVLEFLVNAIRGVI